jgi:hypothetical protein
MDEKDIKKLAWDGPPTFKLANELRRWYANEV